MLTMYVDSSGSMAMQKTEVLQAVNRLLNRYREDDTLKLRLCTFSDTIEVVFSGFISKFSEFPAAAYYTAGRTALYEAVADAIRSSDAGATVIIATDGRDTCPERKKETRESVAKLVVDAEKEMGMRVIYIAEGDDANDAGKEIGVSAPLSGTAVGKALLSEQLASVEFGSLVYDLVGLGDEDVPEPDAKKRRHGDDGDDDDDDE